MSYRIGHGEDIHALVEGRKLILGGVNIPFEKGLLGHSDADVVYHALSDALLGAIAGGDIGQLFPTNDPLYDNLDSSIIVKECYRLVKEKGYKINNVDISIAAEKPHLMKYLDEMRNNIAKLLETSIENVSLKAMTNEGFDAVGEGKAIRATAIALIEKE
jgi:2-C-methyl-D-erythritol 2,4-cyclodiphosphate synthase